MNGNEGCGVRMEIIEKREMLPKEKAIYQAVLELLEGGADLDNLTVSEITKKAGIGKGTAYEYFSDKEEMIAKALLYNCDKFCQQAYEGMQKQEDLYEKFDYLFQTMDKHLTKTNCVIHMVFLSGSSMIGRRMRELFLEKASSGEILAFDIARRILDDEFQGKPAPAKEVIEYLAISIYSKILCFSMLLNEGAYKGKTEREIMRKLVIQGICREIEAAEFSYQI